MTTNTDPVRALIELRTGVGMDAAHDPMGAVKLEALDAAIAALAQQPVAGEEILVNAAHDVFTLPLQPSGLSSGPRFVVHVPAPEQQPSPAVDLGQFRGAVQYTLRRYEGVEGYPRGAARMRKLLALIDAQKEARNG